MAACASFLDDLLHNLKDKQLELKRDEESYGNSLNEEDCGYLLEKYKASFDYFIQDVQAAVDRMPNVPNANNNVNNNGNPSNQAEQNVNNASNNPRGGKRKKHRTKKHRK
jgi:hypothetical protein